MKKLLFAITLISINHISFAQLEIEDLSKEPMIKAIPFNGEFMSFDGIYEDEKKAGVIGEKVTLIDVSTSHIYESEDALKSYKSLSYKFEELFQNKTFDVIDFKNGTYDILTIKNESGTFMWKVSLTDEYVFNKFIEIKKKVFENKVFIPLHNESDFVNQKGDEIIIDGNEKYTITSVRFAKLRFDYGLVFVLNDSILGEYKTGIFDQPRLFNGEIYTSNDKYINLTNNYNKITLIEETEYLRFAEQNSRYLTKIREKNIALGMSEEQCRWAIGTPGKSLKNVSGYDVVLVYADMLYLYFQNDVLKLIK